MAKGGIAKRKAAKRRADRSESLGPTPEQLAQAEYAETVSPDGKRFVRIPPIETLRKRKIITEDQHKALDRFRTIWVSLERSELRSCLDDSPKGGGNGPLPGRLRAQSDLNAMECALEGLAPIVRKVAGEDWSLSKWAIHTAGCKGSGEPVCLPKTNAMSNAIVDIKFAANMLIDHLAH